MTEPQTLWFTTSPSEGSKRTLYVEAQPVAELLERLLRRFGWDDEPDDFGRDRLVEEARSLLAALREHESRPS